MKQGSDHAKGHGVTIDASGRYEPKQHPLDGSIEEVRQRHFHYQYIKHEGNLKKVAAEMGYTTERTAQGLYKKYGFPKIEPLHKNC